MTPETLRELDELYWAATPGKWLDFHGVALCECYGEDGVSFLNANSPDLEGNAAWIVAIHNHFPALLAELRRLEAERDELKAECERLRAALQAIRLDALDGNLPAVDACAEIAMQVAAALTPPEQEK